jgi:hypothetical protein
MFPANIVWRFKTREDHITNTIHEAMPPRRGFFARAAGALALCADFTASGRIGATCNPGSGSIS